MPENTLKNECFQFFLYFVLLFNRSNMETKKKKNPHHDSSSFSFLQPSTLHDCSSQTLPRLCSREAGLCSARNFKVCAPSCFSCRPSLPLFVFSLPYFHCSINISPFPAPFLSLFSSVSHHLICFLLPPCLPLFFFFFLFLTLISLWVNPTSPETSKARLPLFYSVGQTGFMPRPGTLRGGCRTAWKHTAPYLRESVWKR